MKILVLTDPYGKPSFGPRLRYFCEDWLRRGHTVRVITEEFEPIPFEHAYPIDRVSIYRGRLDWFIKSAWSLLTDWRNRYFSRQVLRMTEGEHYDLVFCTTFSTFPLRAARDVAQHKHIPLHVDLRDVDEQVPGAQYQSHRNPWTRLFRTWYKRVNIRRRNRVLTAADSISTVSPWHVQFVRQFNANVHLIYNGYDPEQFFFRPLSAPTFNIVYIGKIYEFQHPEPLFARIRELSQRYPAIRLELHTPDHHSIPLTEVGETYRRSSMAIVLTDPSARGMMTTKFYEALGSEKPIICYPSDEGLLASTIDETHAGIASSSLDAIEHFILSAYKEWQSVGYTRQPSRDITRFSRLTQAEALHRVLVQTAERPRPLVVDICWTLYRANTTFDFLDHVVRHPGYLRLRRWMKRPLVRYANLLFLRLTHRDPLRALALRYLSAWSKEEIETLADDFVEHHLGALRIPAAWEMLAHRDIILVSGTISPIAEAVGRRIGAKKIFSGHIFKEQAARHLSDYDILTDNLSDWPLLRKAHRAYIVTYGNRARWERLSLTNIHYLTDENERN